MDKKANQFAITSEGASAIDEALSRYQNNSKSLEDTLSSELGADRIFGTSHVFDLPREMNNETCIRGPENREYILKVCIRHLDSFSHQRQICPNHMESWTWEEAMRRGDEELFAPVVAAADDYRWIMMEKGYKWSWQGPNASPSNPTQDMKERMRQRGWIPVDIEVHQIEGRTVVTDYELVFPVDLYEGLYHHSFQQPRLGEWKQFSNRTHEAIEQQRRSRR